mgnify:CR=1 FL=1
MESTLQIMPVQRTSRNFGEYAEEAVIIEEPIIKQKRPLFIEANTIEASLEHLRNDCIIPVFQRTMKLHYLMWLSLKRYRMQPIHSLAVNKLNRQIFVFLM